MHGTPHKWKWVPAALVVVLAVVIAAPAHDSPGSDRCLESGYDCVFTPTGPEPAVSLPYTGETLPLSGRRAPAVPLTPPYIPPR